MVQSGGIPSLGVKLTDYQTSADGPSFDLGTPYRNAEGLFVYAKADALLVAGDAVKVDNDGTVEGLTTAISGSEPTKVGVALAAVPASGYGWFWRGDGKLTSFTGVKAAASISADVVVTTTATAGAVGAGGDTIVGLTLTAASGAGGVTACFASTLMYTN